jgi:hypothetical protein
MIFEIMLEHFARDPSTHTLIMGIAHRKDVFGIGADYHYEEEHKSSWIGSITLR